MKITYYYYYKPIPSNKRNRKFSSNVIAQAPISNSQNSSSNNQSSSSNNQNTGSNSQNQLSEEIKSLELEYNDIDYDIEDNLDFIRRAAESERKYLSDFITRREKEKDELIHRSREDRERAATSRNDPRDDNRLFLELAEESARKDIQTLRATVRDLEDYPNIIAGPLALLERLENHRCKVEDLKIRLEESEPSPVDSTEDEEENASPTSPGFPGSNVASNVDLATNVAPTSSVAPTPTTNTEEVTTFPQNSSDVHQSDYNSFDPFGED